MRVAALLLGAALLAGGCATLTGPPALTRDEIVALSKAGASPQAIIDRLRQTGTVLELSASEIVRLHEAGVPREVLDHLQLAQMSEARRREAMLYSMSPYPYPFYSPFHGCPWRPRFHPYGPWGFC